MTIFSPDAWEFLKIALPSVSTLIGGIYIGAWQRRKSKLETVIISGDKLIEYLKRIEDLSLASLEDEREIRRLKKLYEDCLERKTPCAELAEALGEYISKMVPHFEELGDAEALKEAQELRKRLEAGGVTTV